MNFIFIKNNDYKSLLKKNKLKEYVLVIENVTFNSKEVILSFPEKRFDNFNLKLKKYIKEISGMINKNFFEKKKIIDISDNNENLSIIDPIDLKIYVPMKVLNSNIYMSFYKIFY